MIFDLQRALNGEGFTDTEEREVIDFHYFDLPDDDLCLAVQFANETAVRWYNQEGKNELYPPLKMREIAPSLWINIFISNDKFMSSNVIFNDYSAARCDANRLRCISGFHGVKTIPINYQAEEECDDTE